MVNRELLEIVQNYIGTFYQKILIVDLETERFTTIKIDDKELSSIYSSITISDWFSDFANSPYCHPYNAVEFMEFSNLDRLKSLSRPTSLYYRKLIDGVYHNVLMEIIPLGEHKIYLLVKDLTKMFGEEKS